MIRQATLTTLLLFTGLAAAHESSSKVDVPDSAKAAIAIVDRFFAALSSGDLAQAGGLAWVASESELHVERDGGPSTIASTETMVLRSGQGGWKIIHIHWSSRVKKPGESH